MCSRIVTHLLRHVIKYDAEVADMQMQLEEYGLYIGKKFFIRPDGTPFWQFLSKHDIPFSKKHFPFLTTSETPQIKPVFDWNEYLSLQSKGEALAYLYAGFGKAFNYVGPILDLELKHGFNDHTDRHTLWVSQTTVELLQRAGCSYDGRGGYDVTTELLAVLAGMTHDLGNIFGRKKHWYMSSWLLTRLFKNIAYESSEWQHLNFAVLFHEEPEVVADALDLKTTFPLHWALIAADKMHVGRERIGPRSFEFGVKSKVLEQDVHILANALIVRSSWCLGVGEFLWNLDFSVDQLEEKFASFSKGNDRIWLPQKFQDKLLGQGVRYRDTFVQLFIELYQDRLDMAMESIFLLFPFIHRFTILLVDNDTRKKVGSGSRVIWSRKRGSGKSILSKIGE